MDKDSIARQAAIGCAGYIAGLIVGAVLTTIVLLVGVMPTFCK